MKPKELTIRGLILGSLITTVFTAANVYLGLKVGLTFASSIPAAVISMAILTATRVAASEVSGFFSFGSMASSGYNIGWSLALLGAGHLVGLSVGMAMLTGLIIAWGIAVPVLTSMQPAAAGVELAQHTIAIWR